MVTRVAGKTPHGARPNREARGASRTDGPSESSPGRLLDPASNGGARGMIVVSPSAPQGGRRRGQNSAYGLLRHFMHHEPSPSALLRSALVARRSRSAVRRRAAAAARARFGPRPAEGREPEFPPPNIREYKPRSTLVVPQHPVPRAKFPVIDIHGHPPHA